MRDGEEIRWVGETPFLYRHGKQVGIAWGVRKDGGAEDPEPSAPPPVEPEPKPYVPREGTPRAGVKQKVQRDNSAYIRYDWAEIERLYAQDGLSMQEIAKKLGCQYDTVAHALEQRGIKLERKAGPARKQHCKRGHDLDLHGVEKKGGGRYCRACRLAPEREPQQSKAVSAQYRNACPKCGAGSRQPCRSLTSGRITDTHAARIQAQ